MNLEENESPSGIGDQELLLEFCFKSMHKLTQLNQSHDQRRMRLIHPKTCWENVRVPNERIHQLYNSHVIGLVRCIEVFVLNFRSYWDDCIVD